jgi:hypothetical protein
VRLHSDKRLSYCCGPRLKNVDGELWLLYSVKVQAAERTVLETRTSSREPG